MNTAYIFFFKSGSQAPHICMNCPVKLLYLVVFDDKAEISGDGYDDVHFWFCQWTGRQLDKKKER